MTTDPTLSAETAADREYTRNMVAGGLVSRSPVSATIVASMLDLTPDEFAVLCGGAADRTPGRNGLVLDVDICLRFGLEPADLDSRALGELLGMVGFLTHEEGAWLDDAAAQGVRQ